MSTVVFSDLHLGLRSERDLLRRPEIRARLCERLAGVDRVVLLGDTIELRQQPLRAALAAARPFFEDLGEALGDGEVVLVAGNHDHRLLAGWHERRRTQPFGRLGLEQRIEPEPDEPSGALAAWLRPSRLTLAYPGLWLRPDVYAMHGHYLDRHLTVPTLERLAIGAMGLLVDPLPRRCAPDDYEAPLAPLYAWAHELMQAAGARPRPTIARPSSLMRLLGPGVGDRPPRVAALGPLLPLAVAACNRAGLGPLRSDVSMREVRAAGLRAAGEVCARLSLEAAFLVFGHLHRAGPLPQDDPVAWTAPTGTRLVNTGSWVHEPRLDADDELGRHREGTLVRVSADGPPVLEDVLDGWAPNPRRRSLALAAAER